jgi:hypothetical protein
MLIDQSDTSITVANVKRLLEIMRLGCLSSIMSSIKRALVL